MAKKSRRGQKQCPKCGAWVKGTRAKACPKCDFQFNGKQAVPAAEPVATEKPAKAADAITIGQIRAVARAVKSVGGFERLDELLGLVREVGGLRRMKDLLEALAAAQTVELTQ